MFRDVGRWQDWEFVSNNIVLMKNFAFLETFFSSNFFLWAADSQRSTTKFLGVYCYFPVIRLVNFVLVAPVTVVALSLSVKLFSPFLGFRHM